MKIQFPPWSLENLASGGTFQCGLCMNVMHVEAIGEVPDLTIGFHHCHAPECPLANHNERFSILKIDGKPVAYTTISQASGDPIHENTEKRR